MTSALAALLALLSGASQEPPARLPPPDSPPLVRFLEIAFPGQGNVSMIEPQTYLYYIKARPRHRRW